MAKSWWEKSRENARTELLDVGEADTILSRRRSALALQHARDIIQEYNGGPEVSPLRRQQYIEACLIAEGMQQDAARLLKHSKSDDPTKWIWTGFFAQLIWKIARLGYKFVLLIAALTILDKFGK